MKQVTASDARKNWFRLLDEVAAGEVVVIQRNGKRLILQPDKKPKPALKARGLILGNVDNADKWSWNWTPENGLIPVKRK